MNNHPEYIMVAKNDKFILIKDMAIEYQCMSVTNGAEEVVKKLYDEGLLPEDRQLYYVDTDNRVDELTHSLGKFTGFKNGYESEEEFYKEKNK